MNDNDNDCPFDVVANSVEKGKVYPLYGMITKFVSESHDSVIVILNGIDNHPGIELTLFINKDKAEEMIEILKKRSFEPGIFITEILEVEPNIRGECKTVVFGRSHTKDMQ